MQKPIVRYRLPEEDYLFLETFKIEVGCRAAIRPIDHPSSRISNKKHSLTSNIIKHNKANGRFETVNTIYVLDDNI